MNLKIFFEAKITFSILLCFLCPQLSFSQNEIVKEKKYPLRSIVDLFTKVDTVKIKIPKSKTKLIAFPTLGYQPANGFTLGFISQYSFKEKDENKISLLSGGASLSTKKQVLIYMKNNMYLNDDRYFLSGDFRYYVFSQSNFGLGTDIVPWGADFTDFNYNSIEQPMDYNYFKLHETISFNLFQSFYLGTGLHVDGYSNIDDKNLDISNQKYTYHYNYSKKYGFNDSNYFVTGISMNVIYDARDNLINTNKGLYLNLNYRYNPKLFNGQQNSSALLLEGRYFIPFSKINKQHVLGFWAYSQFLVSGRVPYLNLPALGWDQNSRTGMGYIQGLFRGENLLFLEAEYRFPITKNQMISGTVFTNATSTSSVDNNLRLLESVQPAVGVGLRVLLDKNTLTNFIVNFGLGRKSETFYFNDGEGF